MNAFVRTVLAILAVLLGLAAVATPIVREERAQATALVERGQRSVAAGDRAAGVLDLERANALAPRAVVVRNALRAASVDQPEPIPARALRLVTAREWSVLATFAGWLAGVAIAAAIMITRSKRPKAWRFSRNVAIASTSAFAFAMLAVVHASTTATAVVVAPDAHARIAPYAGAAEIGALPAGLVVVRSDDHGPFARVRAANGVQGWTSSSSIEPVEVPSS